MVWPSLEEARTALPSVECLPERDRDRDQGEAACEVSLLFEAAISDFAEVAEEESSCRSFACLAFVEAGVNAASEVDTLPLG
jgi:hypothetical protein